MVKSNNSAQMHEKLRFQESFIGDIWLTPYILLAKLGYSNPKLVIVTKTTHLWTLSTLISDP